MSENILMGKNDCDYLRVVLFCKGPGADKDSYRPKSDEKQWWGRRDALARCVSSFLFGVKPDGKQRTKKELVLLFDEDRARLHMTSDDDNGDAFPKEETLIKLWKQAAQNLRKEVTYKGLKCTINMDPTLSLAPTSSSGKTSKSKKASSSASNSSSIEKIDTKREVLEYIQKHCSIDFLRENRINSHPDVVLRKTNRKALLKIWDTWTKQMQSSSDAKGSKHDDETSHSNRQLKTIFNDLLQFPRDESCRSGDSTMTSNDNKQIIAGILHESADEFPCFRFGPEEIAEQSSRGTSYRVCLFLGAVRDMTFNENEVLRKVCETSKIPFVGIRFGRVPEFTSKILSLLVFHHAHGVLGSAMKRILDAMNKDKQHSQSLGIEDSEQPPQSTCLNIICTIPKSSKEISTRMEDRDQTHWRLVRVIVCSLWRSKLVSSKSRIRHTNTLRLVFEDGVIVVLNEREFVEQLASKHQAAPSEFQILKALIDEIDRQSKSEAPPPPSSKGDGWSRKKLAKRLVKSILQTSPIAVTCTVGIESKATDELVSRFYDHTPHVVSKVNHQPNQGLLMVIGIPDDSKDFRSVKRGDAEEKPPQEIYKQLLAASRKLKIPTMQQRVLPGTTWCWDREAASIIAVQHMCYQNRVFARSCCLLRRSDGDESCPPSGGKKRKKPS